MKADKGHVSAVIVAAGRGTRMNMDKNKQYLEISGKAVLSRAIQAFEDCEYIREIILVVNSEDIMYCKQTIVDYYGFNKVKSIVAGGAERQNSVLNGLRELNKDCNVVLIHDGARPFIDQGNILDSIQAAEEFGAACLAVPVKDTIKSSDNGNFVMETLNRSLLWAIQTPQAFRYKVIIEAHERALEEGYSGTDDTVLAERIGIRVKLVMGNYNNIKITTREDIIIAEAIADKADCEENI